MAGKSSCFLVTLLLLQTVSGLFSILGASRTNGITGFFSVAVPLFSPFYTIVVGAILERCERRGGFFMRYSMASYESTIFTFGALTVFWLCAAAISIFCAYSYFWQIGFFLFTCAAATIVLPFSLGGQANEYERQMIQISQQNLEAGQSLTGDQVHTIYRLNVYRDQVSHPSIKKDRYGRELDDGRAKAIQADNYFKMQKWMHGMKQAEYNGNNSYQLREIYNQMAQQCQNLDLSPTEKQKIQQIAHLDGVVCAASTSNADQQFQDRISQRFERSGSWRRQERPGGWTREDCHGNVVRDESHGRWRSDNRYENWQNQRSGSWRRSEWLGERRDEQRQERRRSHSYLDLRTEMDAPPSYKESQLSLYYGHRRGSDV